MARCAVSASRIAATNTVTKETGAGDATTLPTQQLMQLQSWWSCPGWEPCDAP